MSTPYLFQVRTIAILTAALVVGLVVAGLTYAMAQSWPAAVLAGVTGFGIVMMRLNATVAHDGHAGGAGGDGRAAPPNTRGSAGVHGTNIE